DGVPVPLDATDPAACIALFGAIRQAPGREVAWDALEAIDPQRRCRVCGCTEDNACVREGLPAPGTRDSSMPRRCWWVEENLCSACMPDAAQYDWRHPE